MTRGGYTSKYGRFGFGKISSRYIPYIDPSLDVFFLVFFFSLLSPCCRENQVGNSPLRVRVCVILRVVRQAWRRNVASASCVLSIHAKSNDRTGSGDHVYTHVRSGARPAILPNSQGDVSPRRLPFLFSLYDVTSTSPCLPPSYHVERQCKDRLDFVCIP